MARDNVTFRFNIDLTQMTVKGRTAVKILQDLERTSGRAAGGMDRLGSSSARAGQQTAASAVNFQTATQGMLNLSTAAVQTFTSISNLDRANNRAKMSIIAVARAEDLLNNKIQRVKDMTDQGITSGGKYANMQREIATATADLTVKQEKQKIEQAAVNDIYMLFATNIANVTISSLQTITILFGQEKMAKVGSVIATRLHTFATWDNVRAQRMSMVSMTGLGIGLGATKVGFSLSTVAVKLHTMALTGLKIALGPIGLIFIGISAAMLAYETNLGGVKDTINNLLGVKDDFEESLLAERALTQGLTSDNDALATSFKKLMPVHEQYIKMMRDAAVNRGDARLAASYQAQLQQPARQGNFSSGVGSPSFSSSGGGSLSSGVSTGGPVQSALDQETARVQGVSSQLQQDRSDRGHGTTAISNDPPDPFGSLLQQELFKLLTPPEQMDSLTQLAISEGLAGRADKSEKYAMQAEGMRYEAEHWRPQETDPLKNWKSVESKNSGLKGNGWNKSYYPTGASKSISFGGDVGDGSGLAWYLQGRDKKFDNSSGRQIFYAGTGGEDIANWQRQGGEFGKDSPLMDLLGIRQAEGLNFKPNQRTNLGRQTQFQMDMMNREYNVSSPGMGLVDSGYQIGSGGVSRSGDRGFTAQWKKDRNAKTLTNFRNRVSRGNSFVNGLGGMMLNVINMLKGGRAIISRGHQDVAGRGGRVAGADVISKAVQYGIKSMPEWMAMVSQIPAVNKESDNNMDQARESLSMAVSIASQYVGMVDNAKTTIGFSSTTLGKAQAAGFAGASLYQNISLLAATKRTNFSNTEIIEESKNKLSLTNSQTFAIRFNSTRGDAELQDRFRYVDQLEAMSSGTSPL
tara:strand:- start:1015 stop:3594 length:2580 start_codon:yes stop_codon:yes gene_type:complete